MGYDIYDAAGNLIRAGVCVEEAASALGVSTDEIEWAIEEFGLCDNYQFVVVGNGDPFPA
ncbi:MAG: hypothetical protein Q8M24_00055 [Pseudolabrys sp.]|nr:hypothetical protein [Pseudolabrys sp.]MDP2293840.1 hypothetical protein [Pseudolabrys sp.]